MKKVKGKYLTILIDFIDSISLENLRDFDDPRFITFSEEFCKTHHEYLSDSNLPTIIFDQLYRTNTSFIGRTGYLSDSRNSDIRELLITGLINFFESLPRKYSFQIGLPGIVNFDDVTHEVAPNIKFTTGPFELYQYESNHNSLLAALTKAKTIGALTLEFEGYADHTRETFSIEEVLATAKHIAFLLTSYGSFDYSYSEKRALANLHTASTNESISFSLPDSLARCYGSLYPDHQKLLLSDYSAPTTLLTGAAQRIAATPQERISALTQNLFPIRQFYRYKDHPDFSSVAAAMEWYQDSIFSENQTTSYLNACIGMEAILGSDENIDSLTKRLAERYGYLMGNGRTDRENKRREYEKILRLRGTLVHAKKARLGSEGQAALVKVRSMLYGVIWRELKQIYRSPPPPPKEPVDTLHGTSTSVIRP